MRAADAAGRRHLKVLSARVKLRLFLFSSYGTPPKLTRVVRCVKFRAPSVGDTPHPVIFAVHRSPIMISPTQSATRALRSALLLAAVGAPLFASCLHQHAVTQRRIAAAPGSSKSPRTRPVVFQRPPKGSKFIKTEDEYVVSKDSEAFRQFEK